MRQRVMIAMALSCRPRLLIADEPTTALDVTVQAQVLRLLRSLQREYGMGLIFITHDMGVVAEMADRVLVMRDGVKVEEGDALRVFDAPQHPYTRDAAGCGAGAGQPGAASRCRRRFPRTATLRARRRTVRLDLPPVLEVRGPDDALRYPALVPPGRSHPRGRAGGPDRAPWRDAGAGGRVRLRQIHHRAQHHPAGTAAGRRHPAERRGRDAAGSRRARQGCGVACSMCSRIRSPRSIRG